MAISILKYVNIVSGVGAGTTVRKRDFIGRIFTENLLVPTKSLIEFDNADQVGAYFGTASEEYKRAAFYFGWVSKLITRAKKLGFARWVSAAVAARIYGDTAAKVLASFTAITTGSFRLTIGATGYDITGLNLSGAASLAAVAALVQTAIQAKVGAQFATATVSYDATRGSFNFVSGATGPNAHITVGDAATGVAIGGLLGWTTPSAILSDGAAAESITDVLTESSSATNNFGSFLFIPVLSIGQVTEAAIWNTAQNVMYQYMVPVLGASAAAYYAALKNYAGIAVTLSEVANEYPEMAPMTILAATDYSRRNAVQNYMFQIFALTPGVTTDALSNTYDAERVNYYGRTQTAGQNLDFYQRGVLMGLPVNPVDMNTYANEQWLKDAAGAAIMELLLALARISANAKGRIQLMSQIQSIIDQALFNGTISVGKELTNTQKVYITELTGDPDAWQQIKTIGYWLDCTMVPVTQQNGATEYKAVYTLVYSKDDVIRKVEGSHVLI